MPPDEREGGGGPGWAFVAAWLAVAAVAAAWLLSGQTPHVYARLYGLTRDLLVLAAACGVVGGTAWVTRSAWRQSAPAPEPDGPGADTCAPSSDDTVANDPQAGVDPPLGWRPPPIAGPPGEAPSEEPADAGRPPAAGGA